MQVRDPLLERRSKSGSPGNELSPRQLWKSRIAKSDKCYLCYRGLKNLKLNMDVISLIVPLIHIATIWESELANMTNEELTSSHDYIELLTKVGLASSSRTQKVALLQSLCLMHFLVALDSPLQAIYLPQTLDLLENLFRLRDGDVLTMGLRTCRSILDHARDNLLDNSLNLSLLCLKSVRPMAIATMSQRSLAHTVCLRLAMSRLRVLFLDLQ